MIRTQISLAEDRMRRLRREGIERAIALDADFRTAGFETLP
jgi:hypothetical protein